MCGPVALEAARLLKGRVKMVMGADTLSDVSLRYADEELAGMLAAMEADFPGTVEGLVRSSFFLPTSDPALIDQIAHDMGAAPPAAGIGAFEGFARWFDEDVEKTLANIDVPIHQIEKAFPVAIHAEAIRKRERDLASGGAAGLGPSILKYAGRGFA